MPRFLIDANLPYRFPFWQGPAYAHVLDLGDSLPDSAIWEYARENDLTIVTKDADFSNWIMACDPPPRVVHLRIGNMRLRDLNAFLGQLWPRVMALSATNKLVIVHASFIECIA